MSIDIVKPAFLRINFPKPDSNKSCEHSKKHTNSANIEAIERYSLFNGITRIEAYTDTEECSNFAKDYLVSEAKTKKIVDYLA